MASTGGATTAPRSRWRALLALLRPHARRWVGLGALVALASGLQLAGPVIVRRVVDEAAGNADAGRLVALAVVLLVIAVAAQALLVTVAWFATTTAWRTVNDLRLRLVRHVLGLDHEFHRTHTPGELIQRVDGDVTSVSDFLGRVVPKLLGAAAIVFGMIAVLAVLDWRLAIGGLAYVAIAGAIVARGRHRAVTEASDEMGAWARVYGGIEERLTASEDLRANGAGPHAMWRFVEESAGAMRSAVRRESAYLRLWWALQAAVAGGTVVALVAGAALVGIGAISLGTAFLLFQYALLIDQPLEDLVHELETVQKANGAMIRVIDLIGIEPAILDEGTVHPPSGPLSIEFDRVEFDYGDERSVLHDVRLQIAPGLSVGVVGRSGSGKTTLSRLLLRLVEARQGEVRLGGVPIAAIPLADLRRRVALVPQEVELFSGSIRDNVTLFDPAPTDEAVAHALRRAGLPRLADGDLHRPLGAGGTGLSAGESQLLALARVWLRDPDLVVLDEATARIDPATEALLEGAIAELLRGRTALVIAHRLSTLRHVDDIVVMEGGRVVEHGTRADLAGDADTRFHRLLTLALEEVPT